MGTVAWESEVNLSLIESAVQLADSMLHKWNVSFKNWVVAWNMFYLVIYWEYMTIPIDQWFSDGQVYHQPENDENGNTQNSEILTVKILGKLPWPHCSPSLESWLNSAKSCPNGLRALVQASEMLWFIQKLIKHLVVPRPVLRCGFPGPKRSENDLAEDFVSTCKIQAKRHPTRRLCFFDRILHYLFSTHSCLYTYVYNYIYINVARIYIYIYIIYT